MKGDIQFARIINGDPTDRFRVTVEVKRNSGKELYVGHGSTEQGAVEDIIRILAEELEAYQ